MRAPLRTVLRLATLALALGVLAAPAAAATSSSSNPVINDCFAHPGGLTGHYTMAQLNHALQVMSAETKEYTDCPDVINRALLALVGNHKRGDTGSTGSSSSFLPTPVIVILVVLALAAVTFGAVALRRRQGSGPE